MMGAYPGRQEARYKYVEILEGQDGLSSSFLGTADTASILSHFWGTARYTKYCGLWIQMDLGYNSQVIKKWLIMLVSLLQWFLIIDEKKTNKEKMETKFL